MPSKQKKRLFQVLDEVSGIKELQDIPGFMEEAVRLRERLSDDEFRIAVVGEFSSGKSTFINAILGQDVLKHATTETTAAVTRIVNVAADDTRCRMGRVITRDGKEILMSNLTDLKEYTTTQSERYKDCVPEKIAFVEIYLPFMVLGRPIVLVDTPGLNGMADGHREQTVALIQKAHACIYLIPRGGLGESDILFLTYLTRFQENFIFIQNFIDEFQTSQEDSVPKKLAEQRTILEQKVFAQHPECVFDICGVSALMELASADHNIKRLYADSPKTLTAKERIRIHEQSGFAEFRQMMSENFQEDRMDEIQYGGTARAIDNWIRSLLDHISRQEQQAREFFDASHDKRALEKLEHLREKILAGEQRQRENLQDFITTRGDEIRRGECDNLKKDFEELNRQMFMKIKAIQAIPELDRFEKGLPGELENKVGMVMADGSVRLRQKFQTLYQILLTRIDEYSGVKSNEELDLKSLKIEELTARQISFTAAEGRIEKWRDELESKQQEAVGLQDEGVRINREFMEAQQSEGLVQRVQQEMEAQKNRNLAAMGDRPAARVYEKSYEDSKSRGLKVLDLLFGKKKVTKYRTVEDDSAGKEWDEQRAQIQNAYVEKNDSLNRELAAARRRKNELSGRQDVNKTKLQSVEDKIRQLESNIALESEKLEREKKQAAQEYMNARKNSLCQQIHSYLLGEAGVLLQIEKNMESVAEETERSFTVLAMERFTKALQQKLKWIEQMKEKESPEILRQAENLEGIGRRLQKILTEKECG